MPSALMIIFSALNIHTKFQSRNTVSQNIQANKKFRQDVRFAVLSIFLNVVYILLSLPVSEVVFFPFYYSSEYYILFNFFYFAAYCYNFYLILLINRLFRREFLSLFTHSKPKSKIKCTQQRGFSK